MGKNEGYEVTEISVEEILKEYKYINLKVKELQQVIEDIRASVPGALKAVCMDAIKISPTNSISSMIENKVVKKECIIDKLEIEIYKLQRNNRIIDDTLREMGLEYNRLFYYKYIKELTNKEISKELKVSEMQVNRLLRRLSKRMEKMLE